MVIVAGKGYVDPSSREGFLAGVAASIRQTRTEPGCLDYVVAADPIEPGRINVYERWESKDHLTTHLAGVQQPDNPVPVLSMEIMQYEIGSTAPLEA